MNNLPQTMPDDIFNRLYVDHSHWLQQWLKRKTECHSQAWDLTHDTFIQLFDKSEPIEKPRAFLLVIAKRALFNFWRRRDIERDYLQAVMAQEQEYALSSEELYCLYEAIVAIDQALDGLPVLVKECFLLSKVDGKTYPQISRLIGKSQATVERYMRQAYLHCIQVGVQ